ncbi:MAG: SAM-dependent methyltransferase, partial [Gammaproteobacteria bacterium]|nr:SAM-dependent methyltransferase [Gammaproteobacteria bacterium]
LAAGAALFIDYGYPRREYYHPERARGTLLCHYRHRAHADPLCLPGLQDITAHVDFTAVAEAADALGFGVDGFAAQAHFLLDAGIERLLAAAMNGAAGDDLRLAAQTKTLLLPGEMGERFKAMLLVRGLNKPVSGFGGRDLRSRL